MHTYCLPLPELDPSVVGLVPPLGPQGAQQVQDDGLALLAGQELAQVLDALEGGSLKKEFKLPFQNLSHPLKEQERLLDYANVYPVLFHCFQFSHTIG